MHEWRGLRRASARRRHVVWRGAVLLVLLLVGYGCASTRVPVATRAACDEVHGLSLTEAELPVDYRLLDDRRLLDRLGMIDNPGYIGNRRELANVGARGAKASFASIYGVGDEVGLILNGLLFTEPKALAAFVVFQRSKGRRVMAFERASDEGTWLLLIARDPDRRYSASELEQFEGGLRRYQERLKLTPIFDVFTRSSTQI